MYVSPSFIEDGSSDKVNEMLENIKTAFTNFVFDIEWMDGSTKIATLEKNRRMKSLIGYPYWLFEKGMIDEYYEGVIINYFFLSPSDLSIITKKNVNYQINMTKDTFFSNMVQVIRLSNLNTLYDLEPNNTDYDDDG